MNFVLSNVWLNGPKAPYRQYSENDVITACEQEKMCRPLLDALARIRELEESECIMSCDDRIRHGDAWDRMEDK